MNFINGIDRSQYSFICLEQLVSQDSWARVADDFVEHLPIKELGFKLDKGNEGRPGYHPKDMLKLYLYGYRNGIRSSRKLEHACRVNLEVMWLLNGLHPSNRKIAYFRKNNASGFKAVFRTFVQLLSELDFIEGKTIAIDSMKIRAQNSLKNNYNSRKVERHLEYIDDKVEEYTRQLDQADDEDQKNELVKKINQKQEKRKEYEAIEEELQTGGAKQISKTDPDSKAVVLHRKIVNVGYNIQVATDAKHKLLLHADTGGANDTHALGRMALEVKEILGVQSMDVLADKGYTTGQEMQQCKDNNINTYCSPKASTSNKNGRFSIEEFHYDRENDTYTCPAGELLTTNGNLYKKGATYRMSRYNTKACQQCEIKDKCTTSARGRYIERNEYQQAIDENKERVSKNKDYYKQRQQIIEHQFGSMKRQWHFDHTLMRLKPHVMSEVFIISTCYNLTRLMNILCPEDLKKTIKGLINAFNHYFKYISSYRTSHLQI